MKIIKIVIIMFFSILAVSGLLFADSNPAVSDTPDNTTPKNKTVSAIVMEKNDSAALSVAQTASGEPPIIVNGDKIEYSQEANIVTMEGNVEVTKGDTVLTCDKVVVNTLTNDAHAQGNVVLKDKQGIIKAPSCDYNFKTKTGLAFDAKIAYPPYYGRGKLVRKVSENEIEIKNGYFTTCDKEDRPHYRIQSRLLQIFPEDRVTARAMTFRVANTPIVYMPKYTQNLKDDKMHVQVTPGKSKDWGLFLLTAWRYDLLSGSGGRINFDYREKRGFAWGIDNYYDTKGYGKGYLKTYYMNEQKLAKRISKYWLKDPNANNHPPRPIEEQRYRIQWRHKWEVDKNTYLLAEYHKIHDVTFLKDYYLREYEKSSQPSSYILFNRVLADSSNLSILTQKRTNRIFSETEKLPEIKLDKPSSKIFDSPLYLSNNSSYVNFNRKTATLAGNNWQDDEANQRVDNYNSLSLPLKLAFFDLNPHSGTRETYFQRMAGRELGIFREAWDSGVDVSTRFYRIFNLEADPFGIEINKLRHVISPIVSWAYTHPPTVSSTKLLQFDGLDSIGEANQMNFSLENKLQTKRKNKTVDFLRFIASDSYFFNIEGRHREWDRNLKFDLEVLPYEWMRFESDANYDRKKDYFTTANFDLKASGKVVSWGGGYRYEKGKSSQMTGEILFNLIKGWSFKVYERLQFMGNSLLKEQDYAISKELHCWILDIKYNVLRERGETIWIAMRLKAFPEMSLDYGQDYHEPKPGSQGYPGGKSSD